LEQGRWVRDWRVRGALADQCDGRPNQRRQPPGARHHLHHPAAGGRAGERTAEETSMTEASDLPVLLVVEDDEGLQRQLKWAYDGYKVICAGNRAEAIDALRQHEPAVVTLDLGLPPDPDGTEEGFA